MKSGDRNPLIKRLAISIAVVIIVSIMVEGTVPMFLLFNGFWFYENHISSPINQAISDYYNKRNYDMLEKVFDESKLDFTCVHEAGKLPALDPEADKVFKYARYLEKKKGPKDYDEIGNMYRRAARMKHYKAMGNLQSLLYQGLVPSPDPENEAVDLVDELIKMNIPFGFYIMGTYLEEGFGVKPDREAAMKYFRKAADLGNPDGQTAVANILRYKLFRALIARKFYTCAADQGHAEAAYILGQDYKTGSNRPENRYPPDYPNAVKYYQKAVELGHEGVAFFMSESFTKENPPTDGFSYIGFDKADPERSRRYDLIWQEINTNPGARFPDIDKIVPLPPIPLPEWDGTFEYKKELEKQVPPPPPPPEPPAPKVKPVATAIKPVPPQPPKPIGTACKTGDHCPQSGCWKATEPAGAKPERAIYFEAGTIMPRKTFFFPRWFKWMDNRWGMPNALLAVEWTLLKYKHDDPDPYDPYR